MHGRLGQDHHVANDKGKANDNGGMMGRELGAYLEAQGHEGNLHGRQEKHQTYEGVPNAEEDLEDLGLGQFEDQRLEDKEGNHHQAQGPAHLQGLVKEDVFRAFGQDGAHGIVRDGVVEFPFGEEREQQHRQDGAHRAERNEAEAVFTGIAATHGKGDTYAQGHDEGNGDGAGGNAAGVKGQGHQGPLSLVYEQGQQAEKDHVQEQQQVHKILMEEDLVNAQCEQKAHAQSYGANEQGTVHNGPHLLCQHGEVRFCHGDENAHHEAYAQQHAQALGSGKPLPDVLAHRGHGHIGPQIKKADSQYQQEGSQHKHKEFVSGDVDPRRDRQGKHQNAHRHNRYERLLEFASQRFPNRIHNSQIYE